MAFERVAAVEKPIFRKFGKFLRGASETRANLSRDALISNVPIIQVMIRAASSGVARKVPIPVKYDRTRPIAGNLLTGRTVLVQRHSGCSGKNEDRCFIRR